MGDLERGRHELNRAKDLYIKARDLYIGERENMGLAYTYSELVRVSHALGDRSACEAFLNEAFIAAEASNVPAVVEYVQAVQREIQLG